MLKSIGLGIACLTLSISGVTRATVLCVDGGKYGDDKCLKVDKDCKSDTECVDFKSDCIDKDDSKCVDFKSDCSDKDDNKCTIGDKDGDKDCHDFKLCLDDKDGDKDCHGLMPVLDDKDGKDTCKMEYVDTKDHTLCDIGDHSDKGDKCVPFPVFDGCGYVPCGHSDHGGCSPVAVPAPASATFGGLGVAGIMLIIGLRSRRSIGA